MKKIKKKYFVYYIKDATQTIRYIGQTGDLKRRTYTHNYLYRKVVDKPIYNHLRDQGVIYIDLVVIREFDNKTEAKRFEAYLILESYFTRKELLQQIPKISDR